MVDIAQERVDELERLATGNPTKGRMYEVEIDANPDHFLNYDAPVSQQSAKIQEAFRALGIDGKAGDDGLTGKNLLSQLCAKLGDDALVSSELNKRGIPGVKYFDQASRGVAEGSRNYVVFDDSILRIAKKYGVPIAAAMMGLDELQQQQLQAQL